MAAGEGRRLRPLTERWAKPVLPIGGRPVLATLLHELRAAGTERVTLVVGHLAAQVERLVGDGSAFGLDVRLAVQPRRDGSADAFAAARAAGAEPPFLILAADNVFGAGDLRMLAERFAASGAAGAIGVRRGLVPEPLKPGVLVSDGRAVSVYDLDPATPLTAAPVWGYGAALDPFMADLPGPPFELRDGYQRAIDAGESVAAIEIGPTRDLTDPLDLVEQNFPYLKAFDE